MSKNMCVLIPEMDYRNALKEYKNKTGIDYICYWPRNSEEGIAFSESYKGTHKLSYEESKVFLAELIRPFGYNIDGCDSVYYTTSGFLIAIWNNCE